MKIIKVCIAVQIILIIGFCGMSAVLIRKAHEASNSKNIKAVIEFTENSATALSAVCEHLETADKVIPQIKEQSDSVIEVLKKMQSFHINIPFRKKPLRPFYRDETIQRSINTFHHTSKILEEYNTKTSPALQASLKNAIMSLQETNKILKKNRTDYIPYLAGFIFCVIAILVSNVLIFIMMNIKIKDLEGVK